MQRDKKPTYTSLVLDYLLTLNDFATIPQIVAAGKCHKASALKTMLHLRKSGVVDAIMQEGVLFWYALPDMKDLRVRTMAERAEEHGRVHRKPRKTRVKVKGGLGT